MSEALEDYEDYDSGPFCQHFGDPSNCNEKCRRCGHECHEHDYLSDEHYCEVDCCTCEKFEDEGDDENE